MTIRNKIMEIGCYLLLMITLSFCTLSTSFAQDIKSLESEINNSKRQIEKAEQMLKSNKNQETTNVERLSLVRSQMNNRQRIVTNMKKQREIVNQNINGNTVTIKRLINEREDLRNEYADMMVMGYKNFLFSNSLLFLFAAKDFNELQMRIFYVRRYSNLRYQLSVEIDTKADDIATQSDSLKSKRKELETLVANTQKEINALDADSKKYNNILSDIQKDRKKLNSDIKQYQSNIKKLQSKIQQIIAEEARKEKERQSKASKSSQEKYVAESGEFAKFKGSLISPTQNGIMTEGFGTHQSPLQKNVMINNTGVNFQVPQNSKISCVFNGVVSKIFFFQGLNNSVMVRHGDYFTTYSGLTEVSVQVGDIVSKGQALGSISGLNCTLHFELWKGTTNLNPEQWLKL